MFQPRRALRAAGRVARGLSPIVALAGEREPPPLSAFRPGKPTENAYIESFNGKFRDECLNEHWFVSLDHAREVIEAWRVDYNEVRPHSGIGHLAPAAFARRARAELRSPTAPFVPPAGEDIGPELSQ